MSARITTKSESFLTQVETVGQQLQRWRDTRRHRERIPENLWQAMTKLARVFGVSRVAQALRVDYYALKERAQASERAGQGRQNQAVFVEVPRPTAASHYEVELEDGRGGRMTLRLGSGSGPEMLALVDAFWRRQP
jgi:hypothetical protein